MHDDGIHILLSLQLSLQMCNLIMDQGFDLEAINGNNLSSPSVITDNQFGQFTSSVILQVEGELLIFIATRNGVLLKVATS